MLIDFRLQPRHALNLSARRQGRSSSLRCGRSTLTPGSVQRCPPSRSKQLQTPLTTPHPFRDDYSSGGTDDLTNLVSTCKPCHNEKTAREARAARG